LDLYFIRHTSVNVKEGICYGYSDVELSQTFESEVKILKKKISISPQMIFYSSPLKRCILLAERLSITDPIIDTRLIELNFGDWELKDWSLINKTEREKWLNNFVNFRCPNGESYLDLYKRATVLSYILDIPLKKSFSIQINYGSVSKIKFNQDNSSNNTYITVEYINR
jgi:alpha-ribazole phosphatase